MSAEKNKNPFAGVSRDPSNPPAEKKPPEFNQHGSIRGFDRIHGQAQPDASGQTISVTVHLTRNTNVAGYKKLIASALARPDKTIRFAGGAIRVIVLPDGGTAANLTSPGSAESKSDATR